MFSCEDFASITHDTFGVAGCYGCEYATLNIDFVSCSKEHWCIPMLVPVMEKDSDSFSCADRKSEIDESISLCNDCHLWDCKWERCNLGKELKELVVRFD